MKLILFFILIFSIDSAPEVKVAPLPGNVNTELQEFAPSITLDGKSLYFYSKRNNSKFTDIYKSTYQNGQWSNPTEQRQINSPFDDQSPFIAEDEKFIIFSSNRDGSIEFRLPNGKFGVSRDLYYSENYNGKWSKPSSLSDKINTEEMEENPHLHNSDLYFTRYPFGNPSLSKIFKARIIGNHLYEAVALPSPINEEGSSNLAAVISKDGKFIYFSSNRSGGYGGYDIYRSEISEDGEYSTPENLGPEINTAGDEAYMVIHKETSTLYFCRKNPNESYDIYTALVLKDDTHKELVRDKPMEEIKTTESEKKEPVKKTEPQKESVKKEEPPKEEAKKIEPPKKEELTKKDEFIKKEDTIKETLKEKRKLTLNSVRFDINSSELLPESLPVLNQIAEFLKESPNYKIKITGHTDLTGDLSLNKILSLERAEAVRTYLFQKGISRSRMFADGKGSTEPVIANQEVESNRINRRTEFEAFE